jgi:glucose dehydrogenase
LVTLVVKIFLARITSVVAGLAFVTAHSLAQTAGIPFEDIARPKPGTWPTYDGNLSGNRFSPLDQINTSNVQHLAPKWMFTIAGAPRALQVTPVVVDGVMFVTSVNEAYRLDARTGREIWHYSRPRITAVRAHRAWPAMPPVVSTAALRCSATGCSWSQTTLT